MRAANAPTSRLMFTCLGLWMAAGHAPLLAQEVEAAAYAFVLSSGPFGLPDETGSLDWVVVNDAPVAQRVRVTIWQLTLGGAKRKMPPGSLEVTIAPSEASHNANAIGPGATFPPGHYYEVVVELNDRRVLPTVHVWSSRGATPIPGTRIGPGDFIDLQQ